MLVLGFPPGLRFVFVNDLLHVLILPFLSPHSVRPGVTQLLFHGKVSLKAGMCKTRPGPDFETNFKREPDRTGPDRLLSKPRTGPDRFGCILLILDAKNTILKQKTLVVNKKHDVDAKNMIFCPAERAFTANRIAFGHASGMFFNSILSVFDENL